jgi:enterochelin esterase-like enzyme
LETRPLRAADNRLIALATAPFQDAHEILMHRIVVPAQRPALHTLLRTTLLVLTAGLLSFSGVSAQQARANSPADEATAPTPLVPAPPSYPTVQADGTTTFHLKMPNAQKVELALEGRHDPIPMTREADMTWTVSVPAIAPEIYSYSFHVDGASVLDPHNTTIKTSFFSNQNLFLVPGHPAMPWEIADVPHGVIHHHYYQSKIVGIESQYYVYTPPGFDPRSKNKYPVLYLLHGYSDEPSAWTFMGKANVILDNLIAQGKAKPMVVVMPWGYGDMGMITGGWAAWRDAALVRNNFTMFTRALLEEVLPLVNRQYPLSDKREEHAVAGLSMGGAESLIVGLNHTDYFAWVGGFSAGGLGSGNFDSLFPALASPNSSSTGSMRISPLMLLWIACGTEDGLNQPNQTFIAWLREKNLQPTAIHTPGMHVWMVWRDNLSNFVPLLFQAK